MVAHIGFGAALRAWRKKRHWSQKQFANEVRDSSGNRITSSYRTVQDWEAGKHLPQVGAPRSTVAGLSPEIAESLKSI